MSMAPSASSIPGPSMSAAASRPNRAARTTGNSGHSSKPSAGWIDHERDKNPRTRAPPQGGRGSLKGPDARGRYGRYGGQYIPETLMAAVAELASAFDAAQQDSAFGQEFDALSRSFSGRPNPGYRAGRLSEP